MRFSKGLIALAVICIPMQVSALASDSTMNHAYAEQSVPFCTALEALCKQYEAELGKAIAEWEQCMAERDRPVDECNELERAWAEAVAYRNLCRATFEYLCPGRFRVL